VAGVGLLLQESGYSEFAILANKFYIINPSSEGQDPVVPFVVGTVNGVSQAGINGNMIVDGSILARHIAAESIEASMYKELRQTYVFTGDDSLDANYPFELPFKIATEMIDIVAIKVSFRIMPFRAYATGTPSAGSTVVTSEASGTQHTHTLNLYSVDIPDPPDPNITNVVYVNHPDWGQVGLALQVPSFPDVLTAQASAVNHTHQVSLPAHQHGLSFGIYEESTYPTIHYHVDNGSGYGAASGNYTTNQIDLDITSQISGTGWKSIKFDADRRCRISAIVECKIDINA
jgi:hypothetical protein